MASRSNPFPMGASDPLPAGYVIWFGSLDFVATGDGHGTDILPSGVNPDVAKMASHAIFQYNILVIDIDNTTLGLMRLFR